MDQIGTYVIYVIMFCAVLGALAAIRNDQDGLGKEFLEGLHSMDLSSFRWPVLWHLRLTSRRSCENTSVR